MRIKYVRIKGLHGHDKIYPETITGVFPHDTEKEVVEYMTGYNKETGAVNIMSCKRSHIVDESEDIGCLVDEIIIVSDEGYRYMPSHDVTLRPEDYRYGITAQAVTHLEYLKRKTETETHFVIIPIYTCYGVIDTGKSYDFVAKFNFEEKRWELLKENK